jgi:hypothetical protein
VPFGHAQVARGTAVERVQGEAGEGVEATLVGAARVGSEYGAGDGATELRQ